MSEIYTWQQGPYMVSTDRDRLDLDVIHGYLRTSYWQPGVPRAVVEKAVANSLPFGLYEGERQIGFARVVTDYATFAYLADVFVLAEARGQGLGSFLISCVMACPALEGIRGFYLRTGDAHDFYRKFGFETTAHPERAMDKRYAMPWIRPELIVDHPRTAAPSRADARQGAAGAQNGRQSDRQRGEEQ